MRKLKKNNLLGHLLKIERLKQKKGQKEVCYGICAASYLSKIEHGTVCPDPEILRKLYKRLQIVLEVEETKISRLQRLIEKYYYNLEYHLESDIYVQLRKEEKVLDYSVCTIDWLMIQAFEGVDTFEFLKQCQDYMTHRQKGYFAILSSEWWQQFAPKSEEEERLRKEKILEEGKKGYEILGSAYACNQLVCAYYLLAQYVNVHQMESTLINLAVKEGNTYALADYYVLDGTSYACLNMEKMMMICFERAMNLIQNTGWKELQQEIYYNIGATLISFQKYQEAMKYLDMVKWQNFAVLHKKAMVLIRSGHIEEGKSFLESVSQSVLTKADELKLKELYMECEKDFIHKEEFLQLLEELIAALSQEEHFGHLYFYKDIVVEAYKAQRKYKKIVEFTEQLEKARR